MPYVHAFVAFKALRVKPVWPATEHLIILPGANVKFTFKVI